MEIELRDYVTAPGLLDDWIRGWSEGIMPIRERCGFQLLGAWVDRPQNRFVWVIGYYGPGGFDAAEERYHSLAERGALHPEPSSFVQTAEITRVAPISRDRV
ncbi:NIPSNAP family protein [Intrasporangium sp. YIM S08009]|uniref:NIPSNAP family protein n=1 Tax=Intrasporangium zincisolvens TaxID=3080018 RepID=UPI002B062356|nr:NIPSNAP family protein [Intrasporangium sp. YIM S08009]